MNCIEMHGTISVTGQNTSGKHSNLMLFYILRSHATKNILIQFINCCVLTVACIIINLLAPEFYI
jgi:hypothetical protein